MKVVHTDNAPAAIGPYSQAICVGDLVFTSGQIPVDPEKGEMVETIEEQTKQSLKNVGAILKEAGTDFDHVVKTVVYLSDLDNFTAMNEVYAEFFGENFPARSCFEVAGLPQGALVEIEAVASLE